MVTVSFTFIIGVHYAQARETIGTFNAHDREINGIKNTHIGEI